MNMKILEGDGGRCLYIMRGTKIYDAMKPVVVATILGQKVYKGDSTSGKPIYEINSYFKKIYWCDKYPAVAYTIKD